MTESAAVIERARAALAGRLRADRQRERMVALAGFASGLAFGAAIAWLTGLAAGFDFPWRWALLVFGAVGWAIASAARGRSTAARLARIDRLERNAPQFEASLRLIAAADDPVAGTLEPEPDWPSLLRDRQRARVAPRLLAAGLERSQFPMPWAHTLIAALFALVAFGWPAARPDPATRQFSSAGDTSALRLQVQIRPPAYSGLPQRSATDLNQQVLAGSQIRVSASSTPVAALSLASLGGERRAMQGVGARQHIQFEARGTQFFRIETLDGQPAGSTAWEKLVVQPDQLPTIARLAPVESVIVIDPSAVAADVRIKFEVTDDFGLGSARFVSTVIGGEGDQASASETVESIALPSVPTRRLLAERLINLDAIGLSPGEDLAIRLEVADNRAPNPQVRRSPAVIVRLPANTAPSGDIEFDGLLQLAKPTALTSQRQLIIDTEALLAATPENIPPDVDASRRLAAEQASLRRRYGQFLGEEGPDPAAVEPDGPAVVDGDDDHSGHGAEVMPAVAAPGVVGDAAALVRQFGHSHDDGDAATLFDPATRETLREALRAMWAAEGELGIGEPATSLPHQNAALVALKKVQQAARVYRERVGIELPPIDFARRLTGEQDPAKPLADPLGHALAADPAIDALFRAARQPTPLPAELVQEARQALQTGLGEDDSADRRADLIAALAELETALSQPDCGDCRTRLAAALWQLRGPEPPRPVSRAHLRVDPASRQAANRYRAALGRASTAGPGQ